MNRLGSKGLKPIQALALAIPAALTFATVALLAEAQPLQDQLDAAVKNQNWSQAITIVDQMIQSQPQNKITLEAYKQQLLQLQQNSSQQLVQPKTAQLIEPTQQDPPSNLARRRYMDAVGDYFDNLDPFPTYVYPEGGYLRWTEYPINIYIQSDNRAWSNLVGEAVTLWSKHIPLRKVFNSEQADITVERMPNQGVVAGIAKRTDFYIADDGTLQHRVQVTIGEYPSAGPLQITAVATHEIGHALGLWGHSNNFEDIMFASLSTLNLSSTITDRDLNTLQRVYEQPTLIGTQVPSTFLDNYQIQ